MVGKEKTSIFNCLSSFLWKSLFLVNTAELGMPAILKVFVGEMQEKLFSVKSSSNEAKGV